MASYIAAASEVLMHTLDPRWFVPIINGTLFGLLAMVLHEIGHLCVAQGLGLRVKDIGFNWKGMYTVREAGPPEINLQVSLAGPLTNLALIALWPVSPIFGLANFFVGVCNLLPIPGSDGERALKCLKQMRESGALSQQPHSLRRAGGARAMTAYQSAAKNPLIQPLSRAGKQPSTSTPEETASSTSSVTG
jgi:Zn-dependent protease